MLNFTYCNPVRIIFGKGTIAELAHLISPEEKVMFTYGGGSIRQNGVYDQVMNALKRNYVVEFGGIEPNPKFETLMRAVETARLEGIDFLLAVGGGSVVDGTKFIAAAIPFTPGKEWDIVFRKADIEDAVPLGCVITLPATGSEMNPTAVISREATADKLVFSSPLVYPQFSILDPETTYTLPERQTVNGIVDTFVHVTEQYLTFPVGAALQDRQAEALLLALIDEGPKVLKKPRDYNARSNLMWIATQALNGLIGCGVPGDWGTHHIGHELTAVSGLDHARTLAIVLPAMLRHQKERKAEKLLLLAERVWGVREGDRNSRIEAGISRTEDFFHSFGVFTRLGDYGIGPEAAKKIAERIRKRGVKLGDHKDLGPKEVEEILRMAL
jgi:NADP-dependent alcohol dehydrogenase